ncbi:MAG: ABC transporter ATP-binding protein [Candidatus Velthaea sp.]
MIAESAPAALRVDDLHAWYGLSHVVQGVSLTLGTGEIVALLGRNGAGKTTTLKSIMGLIPKRRGSVEVGGRAIDALPAHRRFGYGLSYVPEERRIVAGLTVRENLQLGILGSPLRRRFSERIDAIAEIFPRIAERLNQAAITMSGGEQQMLAIARALVADPSVILLDEPSEGVMPILVDEMAEVFVRMKKAGKTILLVEQNVSMALEIADRAYILDQGTIVYADTALALRSDAAMQERYCSV